MTTTTPVPKPIPSVRSRIFLRTFLFLVAIAVVPAMHAQTFNVLYTLTNQRDGVNPVSGLTLDRAGNLYGTANGGGITGGTCGNYGCGLVFKLTRRGGGWTFSVLHNFEGGADGADPQARVVFGPNGTLYGTTAAGGQGVQATVFNLQPPLTTCRTVACPWLETVLYRFSGGTDGATPNYGDVVFDPAGNLYGATIAGGAHNQGVVYELTPSGGGWSENVLYSFAGPPDGEQPYGGVILDGSGNLYGTTFRGGLYYPGGTVFELARSGSGWTENLLYNFPDGSNGSLPFTGLLFDPSGNLMGTTCVGGAANAGTVFTLRSTGGNWSLSPVYGFADLGYGECPGPSASLTMDAAGNLYGTTFSDGAYGYGSVFKLSPSMGWQYTDVHDFTGGSDGVYPYSTVTIDSSGHLYGTAQGFGLNRGGSGVIWEITP